MHEKNHTCLGLFSVKSNFSDLSLDWTKEIIPVLETCAAGIILLALVFLAVRATLRLESQWDNLVYHIPFAALRGGVHITYEMPQTFRAMYQGFPPLVSFLQGALWRITGTVNATGVVNYLAFVGFLVYCHKMLRANYWIVGMIALSAPLVLIHTATGYDDLCGNCFLAVAIGSLVHLYLSAVPHSKVIFLWGLAGIIAAAWSKFTLVPIDVITLGLIALISLKFPERLNLTRRQIAGFLLGAAFISALPYIKNMIVYSNPFWPMKVPIFTELFPYATYLYDKGLERNRPIQFVGSSQFWVYLNSLFEINHPTYYSYRPRWVIDQGYYDRGFFDQEIAYRSGGFWAVGVITYLVSTCALLITLKRKKGWIAGCVFLSIICFVGLLPQSNELRYFQFIPLMWATIIGIIYPDLRSKFPRIALAFLVMVISLFGYMIFEAGEYYLTEVRDFQDIAYARGMLRWWDMLEKNKVYCAVDMQPNTLLLTGPTMNEYTILARTEFDQCPSGSIVITKDGIK